METTYTPYSTAVPYFGAMPAWVPTVQDQQRLMSYMLYEQLYDMIPDALSVKQRGQDTDPIYLPAPRTIVETCHRFLGVNMSYQLDPTIGTTADQTIASQWFRKLYARERMLAMYSRQKRYGLIRGDAVYHVVGDPAKAAGSRISVYDVDPAAYFPIEDPDLPGHVIGCHLVTQEEDLAAKKTYIRRRTYRKQDDGTISSELILFETTGWDDRPYGAVIKQVKVLQPLFTLPPAIKSLPIYHVRNSPVVPENLFGSSELKGFERLVQGMDQSISDQELTLAMQGLGVYATNSGPPVDENGDETNWRLGPGEVLELDSSENVFFKRVEGVTTIAPSLDHIKFLIDQLYEASASPEIARGRVDVTLAESGISLRLQLAPLIGKTREKEDEMLPTLNNMHYDLVQMWAPAFGELPAALNVDVQVVAEDAMPQNRDAKVKEIISLATSVPPIISTEHARVELQKLGYEFPAQIGNDIMAEQAALSVAQQYDPFTQRAAAELDREEGAPTA